MEILLEDYKTKLLSAKELLLEVDDLDFQRQKRIETKIG